MKFEMPDGEIIDKPNWPTWKTPYNHDTNFESDRTATFCKEPSLAKQEFKDECDINVILERFTRGGEPPPMPLPEHFADITGRTSYFEMASKIAEANEKFYLLPAEKRAQHLNDPARWADAVVGAVEAGDRETLEDLGIEVPPSQEGPPSATPAGGDSPAPSAAPAASPGPTSGAPNAPSGGA